MKLLIQRVNNASVTVDNTLVSEIGKGLLVFVGIGCQDTGTEIEWLVNKLIGLRIFEDCNGKMNLSVKDIEGDVLLVSQFTLYANCKRGMRPDFINAAKPDIAEGLYNKMIEQIKNIYKEPKTGIFAADMKIQLTNDGPVTIILEK